MRLLALALLVAGCSSGSKEKSPPQLERPADAAPVIAASPPSPDAAPQPMSAHETWREADRVWRAGDAARAALLYDRACQGGHGRACEDRASLYESGEAGPQDPARGRELRVTALRLYDENCVAGEPDSCKELSWWLGTGGYAYDTALLPGNRKRAVELYRRAAELWLGQCERGDTEACMSANGWIAEGFELAAYAKRAAAELRRRHPQKDLAARACDLGDSFGCFVLAGEVPEGAERIAVYRRSCDLGEDGGCTQVALALEGGLHVARDPAQALDYYLRACRLDAMSCFEACRLGSDLKRPQPAACKRGCDTGYLPAACAMAR